MRVINEYQISQTKADFTILMSADAFVHSIIQVDGVLIAFVEEDEDADKACRMAVVVRSGEPIPPKRFRYVHSFASKSTIRHLFIERA
jgi:hypothetical protein